jgi:hypothetical protein
MSGGIGRVLGGYDEMVFRSMVRDSAYIYDVVGLESEGTTIDFQVGANSYLYGTRFVSYLANKFGPQKVLDWFNRTDDSQAYFASQFKNVYQTPLDDEWARWISWEREWQRANLDSIRLFPTTPYRKISENTLGSVSRAYYDPANKKLYAAINYPGQLAHIASIDVISGKIEKICDIPTPALYYVCSLAFDPTSGTLFYTTNNSRDWRDINTVNVSTGKPRRILEKARTGDLTFSSSDKMLWGVRHDNGLSTLVRIPPPYDNYFAVLVLDYGKDLFDIDVSPDGKYITGSLVEISGRQTLVKMDIDKLLRGEGSYETLIEFDNNTSPECFVFSTDGKFLYGTSYYSGVSNIIRYDFERKQWDKFSNCETGLFRPIPVSEDSLIAFEYSGQGFVPVMIPNKPTNQVSAINYLGQQVVEKYPILESWTLGSPRAVNIDSVTRFKGEYNGFKNLTLQSAYPIVEGYKDYTAVGVRLNLQDPIQTYAISLDASYSKPKDEAIHSALTFSHWPWKIGATYNRADFYDLFGPTKTSRKGYSLGLQYADYLILEGPETFEYVINATGYGGLESLPDFQNVLASFDKLFTLRGKLDYKYLRRSLGAVEYEEGVSWNLVYLSNHVRTTLFPRIYGSFDLGFLLPINHSSIWLRGSAGYSHGDRNEPFANFYFGGFGNNWVDYQSEKRYREYYSFPGVQLDEVGGTNYGKLLLEWTLPPVRFRRFGFPSLYFNWARMALFSSGIVTNLDSDQEKRTLVDVGGQVDFKLVMFSRLETTFSLGYAIAVEKDQRLSKELMFSLKIL